MNENETSTMISTNIFILLCEKLWAKKKFTMSMQSNSAESRELDTRQNQQTLLSIMVVSEVRR